MTHAATPVTLLTGFLGSGKTTLLNAALRGAGAPIGVVVNEFGAVGVDHHLVEAANEDVVLLAGGCACCVVRSDVGEALARLDRVRAGQGAPALARVVIETSGLADPVPIEQLFVMRGGLSARYRIDRIIATVDACLAADTAAHDPLWERQVALADTVVLTKLDLADAAARRAADELVDAVNPHAERMQGADGAAALTTAGRARPTARWLPARPAMHDESVASFVAEFRDPLAPEVLSDWLDALVATHGARLLRLKGLVNVSGASRPLVIHAVQHLVATPRFLDSWPDDERLTRLVFIARGLTPLDLMGGYAGVERPLWR